MIKARISSQSTRSCVRQNADLWLLLSACLITLLPPHLSAQDRPHVNIPLVNKDGGTGLTAAPVPGGEVTVEVVQDDTSDEVITRLKFNNPHAERRIAALESVPAAAIEGARVLAFDQTLSTKAGPFELRASVVALIFESDGGAWYRMIDTLSPDPFALQELRVPLRGTFKRATFATDSDEAIRWEQIDRVWLGVVSDGPVEGVFEVRRARFTDEPFRPTSPVDIGETWEVAQDPATRSKLHLPDHPPWGAAYEFQIPGGRHMYAMVRTPVQVQELEAYSALRFRTHLTELPEGIDGLLVMLIEADGTQYRAVPAPTVASDKQTITIPFEQFERGSWSKDENNQLDLEQVRHVAIGMHGTTPKAASGMICISLLQFVP